MKAYVNSQTNEKGITTIEFYTPAHNALPAVILTQMKDAIVTAGNDEKTHVIILKSGGDRTFCAGASFDELVSIEDKVAGKEFFMGFARVINACRTCGKIIIGRFQGKAVGGGVGIMSAVDYAIATKYASIRLSELAIGIGPFVIGPAVERKVGSSTFTQLTLTPDEWQTAEYAEKKGLLHDVFDSITQVDKYIASLSEKLATYNPEALKRLKNIFWEGTEHWDSLLEKRAELSGELVLSDFTRKAIRAIKEKA